MKIAILGARGFLGKNLVRHLVAQGNEVTGFVLELPNVNTDGITYETVNQLLNSKQDELKAFDVTINLAARRSTNNTPYSVEDVREFTLNIPKEFILRTASPRTLVINASTYIQNFQGVVGQTVDSYGAAKQALSEFLNSQSRIDSFRTLDLFLFTIYGPGDRENHLVPSLLKAAEFGAAIDLSPGHQFMNLLYVEDAISNISLALDFQSDKYYEKHYMWAPEYFSVRELVSVIEEITKRKIDSNWGGRNYAGHEMMEPWLMPMSQLPNFKVKVPLIDGISRMWNRMQTSS